MENTLNLILNIVNICMIAVGFIGLSYKIGKMVGQLDQRILNIEEDVKRLMNGAFKK